MKKFFALFLLAGCALPTDSYLKGQTVDIDGRTFFVSARPAYGPGAYIAMPNEPSAGETFLGLGLDLPISNVAAIEAITGCKVQRLTIKNLPDGRTLASVLC